MKKLGRTEGPKAERQNGERGSVWVCRRASAIFAIFTLLTGCAPGITSEVAALCAKDGGFKGKRNIADIESIYFGGVHYQFDGGFHEGCSNLCGYLLVDHQYPFVEVGMMSDEFRRGIKVFTREVAFKRQVFYRYSLQKKGSKHCEFYKSQYLATNKLRISTPPLGKYPNSRLKISKQEFEKEQELIESKLGDANSCIGLERIEKPSSKYGVYTQRYFHKSTGEDLVGDTAIVLHRRAIWNLETQEIEAKADYFGNYFLEFPPGISSLGSPSAWCPNFPGFPELLDVESVVPPAKRRMSR